MRHLTSASFAALILLSSIQAIAAEPSAKKKAKPTTTTQKETKAAPATETKTETKTEPTPEPAAPVSTTQTTSAVAAPPEPTAAPAPAPNPTPAETATAKKEAEAKERSGFQVAPIIGFGLNSTQLKTGFLGLGGSSEKVGAMGFGAGIRAGYVISRGMYFGGAFVYHVGESRNGQGGGKIEGGLAYGGAELGHQIAAGPVIFRPYIGVGYASVTLKAPINNQQVDASGGKIALWPGLTAFVPITSNFFAGVDARYVGVLGIDTNASASGFTFAATGGAKF